MERKIEKITLTIEELSLYTLSPAQREILALIIKGYDNEQIAKIINKAASTVKAHISAILRKTNLKNRTELAYIVGCMQDKDKYFENIDYIKPKSILELQLHRNLQGTEDEPL